MSRGAVPVVLGPEVLSWGACACWGNFDCGAVDTDEEETPVVDECAVKSGVTLLEGACWESPKVTAANSEHVVTNMHQEMMQNAPPQLTLSADFRLVHEGEHILRGRKTHSTYSQCRERW